MLAVQIWSVRAGRNKEDGTRSVRLGQMIDRAAWRGRSGIPLAQRAASGRTPFPPGDNNARMLAAFASIATGRYR